MEVRSCADNSEPVIEGCEKITRSPNNKINTMNNSNQMAKEKGLADLID